MERFIQHDALFVRHFTANQWPFPVHNHNHFELLFVHKGSGVHHLNDVPQSYKGPCLFLLAPEDYHFFEIAEESDFCVLKFNNVYLDGREASPGVNEWSRLVDHLLAVMATHNSLLANPVGDLDKIGGMMRYIVAEWEANGQAPNETIFHLIRAVFSVIKRNALDQLIPQTNTRKEVLVGLINYIHMNIQDPDCLQLSRLAGEFNLSVHHLTGLFKQQMGQSIKEYINTYKLTLLQNRLKFSPSSVKEISNDFGFTDMSHFNKFIRKHTGLSPKDHRAKGSLSPE